jgi:hypothetical protein
LEGDHEDIIELNDHYYIVSKKDMICVLPYTISSKGLLDEIGVVKDWNYIEEKETHTLINGYVTTDDTTGLVAANRILYDVIGRNIKDANDWMYLGQLHNNLTSDSPIKVYAVNISNVNIKMEEDVEDKENRKNFIMMSSNEVIQSDDMLFLAGYTRLFNFFYINSLIKK